MYSVVTPDRRQILAGLAGAFATGALFSGRARAADPKTLVGAIEEDPSNMNPAITSILSASETGGPVYSGLMWTDGDGKVHPDLAESWEMSPDGLSYTFHLRRGVLWHDGQPFTSADAKFSIGEFTAKLHPIAKGAYKALAGIDAPDDFTLIIRMTRPTAAFLNVPSAFWPIVPRHIWEGTEYLKNPHITHPIGTGPFAFSEYVPGDHIRYVKNQNYYIKTQPAFDEVVLRIIPDAAARVAAFENGELDFLPSSAVPSTELARLMKKTNVGVSNSTLPGAAWLGIINTRNSPYSDVRVRQALAHAIDRKFIRDSVLPGISYPMVGPLPPSSALYDKTLKDYDFNPDLANQMLDEAGFKKGANGMRFDFRLLWVVNDIRVTKMGDVIAQNLKNVGINTVLKPLDRSSIQQIGYIGGQFDMIIDSYALGPDPDIGVERLYNSNNILPVPYANSAAYSNPAVDKLFDEQRVQTDVAARKEIYGRIQQMIWADVPVFPLCAYTLVAIFRSNYVTTPFVAYNNLTDSFGYAKPVE